MDEIVVNITEEVTEVVIRISNPDSMPSGGTAGQILVKVDGNDYNVSWQTPNFAKKNSVLIIDTAISIDVNCDNYNRVIVTEQASDFTISNPSGTPEEAQQLIYSITDNGTARNITLGDEFVDLVGIPPATTPGKVTKIGCERANYKSKWEIVATVTEP